MRRSEFLKSLAEELESYPGEPANWEEAVQVILRAVEKLGMLPPIVKGEASHKVKNRCRWEPENAQGK